MRAAWCATASTAAASCWSAPAWRPSASSRSAPTRRSRNGCWCYVAPNGDRHKIEFLANGQQAIFYGYHEGAKRDYTLARRPRPAERAAAASGSSITELEADELLTELDELLTEQFGYERVSPGERQRPRRSRAVHVTDVGAALAALDYAGHGGGGNIHDTALGCINALIVQDSSRPTPPSKRCWPQSAPTPPLIRCARDGTWKRSASSSKRWPTASSTSFPTTPIGCRRTCTRSARSAAAKASSSPQLEYDRLHKRWHYPSRRRTDLQCVEARAGGNARASRQSQKFRLVPFGQLRPGNDPGYLVDELIPLRGIVLIWGKRKCLKSFWTYDLSFHVAHYFEYRGRGILQGPVVYCAFEGAHGYKKRAEALRRYHKIPDDQDVPLYLVPGRANMIKEYPLLIAAVREQLFGEVPRMIVLDTLNKSLVGSESKDVDMGAYIVAAEALRDAFDCVVVIIHHCGYDETHPRGHTSLTGAVDAEFEVVREGMLVTVRNVTMRDGPEGFEIRSLAEVVEVGEDVSGKVLTSLVITQTDAPAAVGKKRKGGRPNVGTAHPDRRPAGRAGRARRPISAAGGEGRRARRQRA